MHDISSKPDARVLSFFTVAEKPLLILVALVTGPILLLWSFPSLAPYAPDGWSRMTPTTALALLFAAGSLGLSAAGSSQAVFRLSRIAAIAVLAIGAGAIGIGGYLRLTVGATFPLQMFLPSPQSAIAFAVLGSCLLLLRQDPERISKLSDFLLIVLLVLISVLFSYYMFDFRPFVGRLSSPQTAFCLLVLAVVTVGRLIPARGIVSEFAGSGIGSRYSREIMPVIVASPFVVFSLIAYLNETGLMPLERSRAVVSPMVILAALSVVVWMGRRINGLERDLRRQSSTDPLTSVLNRRGFDGVAPHVVGDAQRRGTSVLVVYFDLDGLKRVNDAIGHEAGSLLIKHFAEILVATFRKNDVVARIGGDEFVVLAAGAYDRVEHILDRLDRNIAEYNIVETDKSDLSYSVGYAEMPGDGVDLDDVIALADRRMYQHKQSRSAGRVDGNSPEILAGEPVSPEPDFTNPLVDMVQAGWDKRAA